jgi:hypothetical protein
MERLAQFINNYHGPLDYENIAYNFRDYLGEFIGVSGKEVYADLMKRMKNSK